METWRSRSVSKSGPEEVWNTTTCWATLHCKSSLKAVLCRWHLTLSECKQQQKKLSPVKTFPNTRAVSAGAGKAPGRGSASVPALGSSDPWVPQRPRQCWVPRPESPPNSRALSFVQTLTTLSRSRHCLPGPRTLLGKSSGSAMRNSTAPACWQTSADLS